MCAWVGYEAWDGRGRQGGIGGKDKSSADIINVSRKQTPDRNETEHRGKWREGGRERWKEVGRREGGKEVRDGARDG